MFEGTKCPYCNQFFSPGDDIVVCPDCGTPHHRDCYKMHAKCANFEKHGSFEWKPVTTSSPIPNVVVDEPKRIPMTDVNICPVCGKENKSESKYCNNCGSLLLPKKERLNDSEDNKRVIRIRQVSTNEKIDGIPIKDWLVYLGPSSASHIRTFLKQNNNNSKFGFALGAFFFPVLYFLYYKVWGFSLLILLVDIICNMPTILLQLNAPIIASFGLSLSQFTTLANVLSYIYIAIVLFISLFAKTIIRRNSSKAIKRIRRSCTNENDYALLLVKKSCPNKILMGTLLILYIVSFLFLLFT